MNASQYKKYHESFMDNNHGTTALHTFLSVLFTVLCSLLCCFHWKQSQQYRYIYEYIIIVVPLIFGHTLFADYISYLNLILILLSVCIFLYSCNTRDVKEVLNGHNVYKYKRLVCISTLRGLTYLITVFCILAVDFRVFPRFLAKTERYGFSLMDTGVGLFILMSGLVHKNIKNNLGAIVKNNCKLISILLSLGALRGFTVKRLDYQEHVTEYGVHWNFFYTLAISKAFSTFILYLINNKHILHVSILISVIHELFLSRGLQKWVFSDVARDTFVNANREGISSCLGYVSLYLFAVYIKNILKDNTVLRKTVILRLLSMSAVLWFLLYFVNIYKPISRTLANTSYCIFLEAQLLSALSVMYIFEIFFQFHANFYAPSIVTVINSQGLLYFLFANIITGLINLTMRTFFINAFFSILLFNVYMVMTIAFASFLHMHIGSAI